MPTNAVSGLSTFSTTVFQMSENAVVKLPALDLQYSSFLFIVITNTDSPFFFIDNPGPGVLLK